MTYAGAGSDTAREIAQTLNFPETGDQLHADFGALSAALNAEGQSGEIKLSVANALWGQKGYGFKPEFLQLTQRNYGAGLQELDFAADADGARKTINAWVEKETQDKIKDLLGPGVLDSLTRLVLTNAIYFKGNWAAPFRKQKTKDGIFHTGAGKEIRVPLMTQTAEFGYMETPDLQGLEMPYAGGELSMVVLLPRKDGGFKSLESKLTPESMKAWLDALQTRKVLVYLPKFKTASRLTLNSILTAMGMKTAFTPSADFSGMDGKRDLYISAAIHKAFIDVNEEGTEAAAATATMIMGHALSAFPPMFRADHPFIFLIRDKQSGSILFVGRLSNPKS